MHRAYRFGGIGGFVVSLVLAAFNSATAQQPTDTLCFSPQPFPKCHRFVFFDAQLMAGLYRAPHTLVSRGTTPGNGQVKREVEDLGHYGAGIIGFMSNREDAHAVGASLEFGYANAEHPRISAKVHRRTWLANASSIDVSVGALAAEIPVLDEGPPTYCLGCLARGWSYGLTGDVAVAERHGVGLVAGADIIAGNDRTSVGLHAGARTESWTAVAATALAGLLGLAAYALVAHSLD
ncbi:MAG: hypothetical protein ABJE47_00435 [bacterium]